MRVLGLPFPPRRGIPLAGVFPLSWAGLSHHGRIVVFVVVVVGGGGGGGVALVVVVAVIAVVAVGVIVCVFGLLWL